MYEEQRRRRENMLGPCAPLAPICCCSDVCETAAGRQGGVDQGSALPCELCGLLCCGLAINAVNAVQQRQQPAQPQSQSVLQRIFGNSSDFTNPDPNNIDSNGHVQMNNYAYENNYGATPSVPPSSQPQMYRSAPYKDVFMIIFLVIAIGFEIYYMILAFGLANHLKSNVHEDGVQFTYMSTAMQVLMDVALVVLGITLFTTAVIIGCADCAECGLLSMIMLGSTFILGTSSHTCICTPYILY